MERPDICIYHGNCADGFASAWAVWKRWGDAVQFVPGVYGEAPPDVTGKTVLMVDFSYKLPVLTTMGYAAKSITILDHHKTAEEDLRPFSLDPLVEEGLLTDGEWAAQHSGLPVQALFDMNRSGAAITWDYCFPDRPQPWLIRYVQDRDLWRFELPRSREIAAALFSHPYDFNAWDQLAWQLDEGNSSMNALADEGQAIERKHFKDIAELLKITTREMVIGGHRVKVANLPYTMSSDAANALAEGAPFGACYFDRNDGQRIFSLRSKPEGLDVADIAKGYGGGGHARASGFQMPIGWEGDTSSANSQAA